MTGSDTAPRPYLGQIAAGDALADSLAVKWAIHEIIPDAEHWVGRNIVLECDERGWSIRYTHGNNYRDRLTDRGGDRFNCAEDAIQALAELIAKNKSEYEREETSNV